MNDDELKNLWQSQPLKDRDLPSAQLISAMQNKTSQLRRDLRARDLRELAACGFILIVFGYFFFAERAPISRIGWLIVAASSVFIAWKLVHARRTTPPAAPGATIVEALRADLRAVRAQSRLLGSVFWWYLLPPGIGLLLATWGLPVHLHAKIPATLVFIAVYALVYWLNQWARSKQLLPLEAQLERLLHSAETGEPLDETNASNLPPLILASAAVNPGKPAEFGVAFWQLAIYAETGFLGAWFFWMLGATDGHLSRMLHWHYLVWSGPLFLAGLLFSWVLHKATKGAVGISPLGVHLSKGRILLPWDEIKQVKPLKILNIQSLWLITLSGEKMLLPWTSLERHAELKSAVEGFAPANHPIRKYLSLLTRVDQGKG